MSRKWWYGVITVLGILVFTIISAWITWLMALADNGPLPASVTITWPFQTTYPIQATFPMWYCGGLVPLAIAGLLFALLESIHRTRVPSG